MAYKYVEEKPGRWGGRVIHVDSEISFATVIPLLPR
jgi:hypothetical protein